MGKLDIKKKAKEDSLLSTAYRLFTTKGISKTSVSDITTDAGVAKGTFYLYFKDKYDLKDKLVAHQSSKIFREALDDLAACKKELSFNEKIIFIIDNILTRLEANRPLLIFISKNLSWGIFKHAINSPKSDDDLSFRTIYEDMLKDAPETIQAPEIMLFTIVELVSSTCYSSILFSEPVGIEEFKPYLYKAVNDIIDRHTGAK